MNNIAQPEVLLEVQLTLFHVSDCLHMYTWYNALLEGLADSELHGYIHLETQL